MGCVQDFLRVGFTGHTSQHLDGSTSRDGANLLQPGQASYSALGEAYLELKHERAFFRGGMQQLDIPYINASDSLLSTGLTYTTKGGNVQKPFGGSPSVNSIMLSDMDRPVDLAGAALRPSDLWAGSIQLRGIW